MVRLRPALFSLLLLFSLEAATAQDKPVPPPLPAQTAPAPPAPAQPIQVASPNGQIVFFLYEAPTPDIHNQLAKDPPPQPPFSYTVEFHGKPLIAKSTLGLDIAGQPAFGPGMRSIAAQTSAADETYTIPVGKTSTVRNHYNAVRADFQDGSGRKLTIEARVFDDGVAFRYLTPAQPSLKEVHIAHELTEFTYAKDATTYPLILDGFQSSWEDEYQQRLSSGLHKDWLIGTPLLAEEPGIGWVAITEADIDNYAGMYLRKAANGNTVRAEL